MKKMTFHSLCLGIAAASLLALAYLFVQTDRSSMGLFAILFFMSLALGVRGTEKYKSFSYTIWIFAAVSASLFYPQYFQTVGDFKLKTLIIPLLQLIMFGMGSQMSFEDFTGVIKMPKSVLVGVTCQFTIMPLTAYAIAHIFSFPPEIAAGIILIGTVPSGLASNVMSYIAHANLPLGVTISAIATLLAPFLTPFLMQTLGGQFIEINFWSMMLDILNMIILPIVAGFIFNLFSRRGTKASQMIFQGLGYLAIVILTTFVYVKSSGNGWNGFIASFQKSMLWFYILPSIFALIVRFFASGDSSWLKKILSGISMVGIALIITIITSAGRDSLMAVGALLLLTSLLHNSAGYILGYAFSWLAGLPEKDRRTVAFEVGMQNGGLASGLALQMGKIATVGLAPAIFGPLMNITGSALASWWRGKMPPEDRQSA